MTTLYLIRHGQTDWNKEGRIQGHLDVHLNDLGRAQAQRLKPLLSRWNVQFIATSDLVRAHETAKLAAPNLCGQGFIHIDPRFREVNLGKLQGKTRQEIERDHGIQFSNELHTRPLSDADILRLGSEHGSLVIQRVIEALEHTIQKARIGNGADRIALISHGGVIRRILAHAHPQKAFPPPIGNGAVYPLTFQAGTLRLLDTLEF